VGLFFAGWVGALLQQWGVLSLGGTLPLALYPYFGLAAFLGWVSGNVYLVRRRRLPPSSHRRALLIYFLGPPGLLYLLRSMAPVEDQLAAPLVPVLAFGVFAVFFLVPMVFGRKWSEPVR